MRRLPLLLATLPLLGATCQNPPPAPTPAAAPDAGPPPPADAGPPRQLPETAEEDPTAEDLPGYPLDQVLPSLARRMLAFARDAFSYDGCPTPLQACLKQPAYRRHALKVLTLATRFAADGQSNTQINTLLNRYYASFAPRERAALNLSGAPCQGPEGAKVTVVVFSDFECPHCAAALPLLEGLVTSAGLVRLCAKPFPLNSHLHAHAAAEAALFARDKGRFWEMHDALFAHQEALDSANLVAYARELGLPGEELARALERGTYAAEVDASRAQGKAAHVEGTPAVFINGRPLVLPLGPDTLKAAIDDELEFLASGGRFAHD